MIKIDSKGNAKLLKWVADGIKNDISGRRFQKENFREHRKLDIGYGRLRYYKRICVNTQSTHLKFDGVFYDSRKDPPQTAMCCNCCYAEWLLTPDEIKPAKDSLSHSKR
ncbi:hypothetical protein D3C76_1087570 [compost metagenome]